MTETVDFSAYMPEVEVIFHHEVIDLAHEGLAAPQKRRLFILTPGRNIKMFRKQQPESLSYARVSWSRAHSN